MLRTFLAGLVLLAAFSAVWADSPAPSGSAPSAEVANSDLSAGDQAMLKEAADKFNRSDIKGALDTLNQVARQNPKLIPPRLILAQWFAQTGNQPAVRVSLEKAVEENPDDPEAYVLLGEIALNQGELTAADLLFQKASACDVSSVNEKRQKTLSMRILRGQARL
ncbi:MAG: tetratricopeptide repeat protein [Thermoguttaceae bacterium]|nr:tetratricopeptide repeat protein [Thermoguttaceae bacterium]